MGDDHSPGLRNAALRHHLRSERHTCDREQLHTGTPGGIPVVAHRVTPVLMVPSYTGHLESGKGPKSCGGHCLRRRYGPAIQIDHTANARP